MTKITIMTPTQYRQLIDEAQYGFPYEVCGLIGGRDCSAVQVTPIPNIAKDPRVRYEMDRTQMVATIIAFQSMGLDVLAIYHSHPHGPAVPSSSDLVEATWPDAAYIIIGLENPVQPQITAWRINRGKAEQTGLRLLE